MWDRNGNRNDYSYLRSGRSTPYSSPVPMYKAERSRGKRGTTKSEKNPIAGDTYIVDYKKILMVNIFRYIPISIISFIVLLGCLSFGMLDNIVETIFGERAFGLNTIINILILAISCFATVWFPYYVIREYRKIKNQNDKILEKESKRNN